MIGEDVRGWVVSEIVKCARTVCSSLAQGLGGFGNGRPKNKLLKDCFQHQKLIKLQNPATGCNWDIWS